MSNKNKKGNNGNQNQNQKAPEKKVRKERKPIIIDDVKKAGARLLLTDLVNNETFPKFTDEAIKKIADFRKMNEKTLKVFCIRLTKFVETISRGKQAKKKEVGEDLKKQIIEIASETANRMSQRLMKTAVGFKELLVLKKSKDTNAFGRAIFISAKDKKEYFLSWDYKNEDLFVGSTLHEYTDTIKANDTTSKKKKKEDKKEE